MNPIIRRITKNRLNDFKGLAIEGEIPVSEEMLNELIQLLMGKTEKSSPDNQASNSSMEKEHLDFSEIINMLDEKEVKIGLKDKKAILKIAARKY